MFDMQRWLKQAGRTNIEMRRIRKGDRENEREMIRIFAKDTERQLGMLTVKRGEIMQKKHTEVCWWGIDAIEGRQCSNTQQ